LVRKLIRQRRMRRLPRRADAATLKAEAAATAPKCCKDGRGKGEDREEKEKIAEEKAKIAEEKARWLTPLFQKSMKK